MAVTPDEAATMKKIMEAAPRQHEIIVFVVTPHEPTDGQFHAVMASSLAHDTTIMIIQDFIDRYRNRLGEDLGETRQ